MRTTWRAALNAAPARGGRGSRGAGAGGIARGGLPGAVFLDHLLGSPPFGSIHACKTTSNDAFAMNAEDEVDVQGTMLPDGSPRRVLLVEDIVAIGDVFHRCAAILRERY